MRLSIVIVGIAILLVAGTASAGRVSDVAIPEEVRVNSPAGTVWDEERGLFRFDPPIPIAEPQSNLLSGYGVMLYYDNGYLYYTSPQLENYFPVTRFTTPESENGFLLTAVLVACYNDYGYEPEEGKIVVYTHSTSQECYYYSPGADKLEAEWFRYRFVGAPFSHMPDPYNPPLASWTVVELDPPLMIDPETDPEFWVAWDYTPGFWERGAYYTLGGYSNDIGPGDDLRFCEAYYSDCPTPLPYGYGAWGIRALGEIDFPERAGGRVDVKPTSCPNPLKFGDIGDVCVAIVGDEDFDVSTVYAPEIAENEWKAIWMTVPGCLHKPPLYPYKETGIKDVVTPHTNPNPPDCYDCTTEGADGYLDWPFHFKSIRMWEYLEDCYGELRDRECKLVEFHWLVDEEPIGNPDGKPDHIMSSYEWFWIQIPGAERDKPGTNDPPPQTGATRTGDANGFALYQNTPNPFRTRTTISFSLPASGYSTLTLHDAAGRTVARLVDEELSAGTHAVEWNAGLPSGVYFCRLVAGGETAGMRMVVAR